MRRETDAMQSARDIDQNESVTRGGKRITDDTERAALVDRLRAALEAPGLTGT